MAKNDRQCENKTSVSFVGRFKERLIELYFEVLEEADVEAVNLIKQKFSLQPSAKLNVPDNKKNNCRVKKQSRMQGYIEFWNNLNEVQQFALSQHDAKINHLSRVARIMGTTEVLQAHNSVKPNTAGSIDYVLECFRKEAVTAEQVQRFIDENAVAWFSLTGHPTNPTTVAYTKVQLKVARMIASSQSSVEELKNVLRELRDTPIVGDHKSPLDEAEETLGVLDVIYNHTIKHKLLFEKALLKHGYAAEGVKIKKPMVQPCAWTLGDGDGNANMTAQVLKDGIAMHRRHIIDRYRETIEEIVLLAKKENLASNVLGQIEDLLTKIKSQALSAEDLALEAVKVADGLGCPKVLVKLNDLAYLIRCFGLGFGKIDLRHNAVDVMTTLTEIVDAQGLVSRDIFSELDMDEKASLIKSWLEDEDVLEILFNANADDIAENDVAKRIFARLTVIGQEPDMCEKLIIAETTHPAHALAALLLLKISGNEIANESSNIDLVVLSESVADLFDLGNTVRVLLQNETFRKHVEYRKRLVVMIAKSDTTRQDGRGEAEYAQYEAAVDVYRTVDMMQQKYPELESIRVSIKNGGGHALQRGGGRVTEVPAVHGRAASAARVTDIGPSTLTIQGQQQSILFCPGNTALGTLEALASQNLYTKAGVQGEMHPPAFSKSINKQFARADARLYAKTAGWAFDVLTASNPAIDELLVAAPWLSMKAGNVSSRPSKRGEKMVSPGITPAEAKGNNPRALAGRAISGERLTAHACLPVFSVLGLLEAMQAVLNYGSAQMNPKKYGDSLHHLYRAHKIYRDAARATVNAVAMADFDIAWPLLVGKLRPSEKEVKRLARKFIDSDRPFANKSEVTMAFLERYFLETEKLTYEMISGQQVKRALQHGGALKELWPELAQQVAERDRDAEFARVIECYRARQFDAAPDMPLSEIAFRITQALYTTANVINTPAGILATRTRLEPVYEVGNKGKTRFMRPESYQEDKVKHLLNLPLSLS